MIDITVRSIKTYLRKHFFLIFRYNSEYYSLKRSRSVFCPKYSFVTTDTQSYCQNSLAKLCKQVYVCNNTPLIEAIECIEIPKSNDPSWETYEAIRHIAIVYGGEIHFSYHGVSYWIAQNGDGSSHLSDDFGNTQRFASCRDLFINARIDGKTLKDIWNGVVVDSC